LRQAASWRAATLTATPFELRKQLRRQIRQQLDRKPQTIQR
jgi:hypothetical protein